MAIISVQSEGNNGGRWVKEGSQIGHFIIQEIRPGTIIYRKQDSAQPCEMQVESKPLRGHLVQRYVPELADATLPGVVGMAAPDMNVVGEVLP